MDYITVGEILKPQGIKGAVKVKPLTDDPKRFERLKLVYIDSRPYPITSVIINGGFVVLTFAGIDDRNAAELLRGKLLEIDRVNAVDPGEGYLVADIIGCTLTDERGRILGEITDVDAFGAADVITGRTKTREFRFPFLNKIVFKIAVAEKRFMVYKKLWEEVTVFDD